MLLVLVGAAVGVFVAEVMMRWADLTPNYRFEWQDAEMKLDPEVLFRIRPHARADINGLGFRDYEFDRRKGDRDRILMMGDSFQFGDNVAVDETLAKALERSLGAGVEVFNLGVPGYGPDQSYGQLLQLGLDLSPDAVVLSLFPANDFNDLLKNQLYLEDSDGRLSYNSFNPVAEALPVFRTGILLRRAIAAPGFDIAARDRLNSILGGDRYDVLLDLESESSRRKIELMRGILRLFAHTLESRGVDFFVFIIPSEDNIQSHMRFKRWRVPEEAYFNNELAAEKVCEEEGINYVSLRVPFYRHRWERLFTPGDGHLSVAGVQLATAHVVDLLNGVRAYGVTGSGASKRSLRR